MREVVAESVLGMGCYVEEERENMAVCFFFKVKPVCIVRIKKHVKCHVIRHVVYAWQRTQPDFAT